MNWERVEDHLVQILAESLSNTELWSSDRLEAAFGSQQPTPRRA